MHHACIWYMIFELCKGIRVRHWIGLHCSGKWI